MRSETELERPARWLSQRGRPDAAEAVRRSAESSLRETRALNRPWPGELQEARHSERNAPASSATSPATGRWPASSWSASPTSSPSAARRCWRSTRYRWRALQEPSPLRAAREAALAETVTPEGATGLLQALEEDPACAPSTPVAPQRDPRRRPACGCRPAELAEGQHAARLEEKPRPTRRLAPPSPPP